MYDLRNMAAWEAVQAAIEAGGRTRKDVAERAGISLNVLNRYCSRQDGYEPSLGMVVRLCMALDNTLLVQWAEAQLEMPDDAVPVATCRADVLTGIARATASFGDANRLAAETSARGVTPADAREIRSALLDVIGEARMVMAMLQPLAAHRDVRTCAPLASLRPPQKHGGRRPWWRFWR